MGLYSRREQMPGWIMDKKNEMVHVLVISQNQFKVTIGALIIIMFILCSDEKADFILTH